MKSLGDALKPLAGPIAKARTRLGSSTSPTGGDALEPDAPPCPVCGGVGWLRRDVPVGHPDFGRAFPCACITDELARRRAAEVRTASHLAALEEMTFETFRADAPGNAPEAVRTLEAAWAAAKRFAEKPEGWLVLWGGFGAGKTHLAAAIANARLTAEQPALFVVVPDLLDYLRAAFAPDADSSVDERLAAVRGAPLLILDDLGTQSPTPWAAEKLFQILNHRYTLSLPTVITTNLAPDAFDERLRSRLGHFDLVKVYALKALDYRGGVSGEAIELSSLHLYRDATFAGWDTRSAQLPRAQSENLVRAQQLGHAWAADPRGWLVLLGENGSGKTHLAAAIANDVVARGGAALFVVVPDLLDHLRNAFSPNSRTGYDKRFEEVRSTPLLILDDLGTESATPWAQEKLYQLLNHRYAARLPTVITTSARLDTLHPRLRTRMFDRRLCTMFEIIAPPYHGPSAAAPGGAGATGPAGGARGGGRRRSA